MSTNEDAIMKFLSPLLPRTQKNGFQPPFSEFSTQTQLHKAYEALKDHVNGTSVVASIVGTVEKPVEFFLLRYQDQSLTSADRQLSLLAMRALCAPVSSASAERIGSRLRKLGEFDRMQMGDTAMQRNLYFSGNGIYTDQLVSIASYRATLSEGPVPPAAPMVPIKDDQQRSLPEKPVNKIIEKLQREIESFKRQLGQVQPTPKGAPQPDATSIKRFFTLSTVKIPAPQQKPPAVSAGTAPELRTKEAADALVELANPHTDNKGLGKRHRHAAVSDASNECEDSDGAVEDGEDIVLELEDVDEDASADNIDTGFSRKKPKNTKSSKSTNNSSKKNKKT
jgi:hypothetical protein